MFYKYEIIHNNNEDYLYLYLTMQYEFANEFSWENQKDLTRRTKNFIVSNDIPFHGTKVYLIVDDKIVKSLNIEDIEKEDMISNEYSMDSFLVNIRIEDHSYCEVSLREYIISILLSFYQEDMLDEVYKAIGVLFNTYAYRCMETDGFIEGDSTFAVYKPSTIYRDIYPSYDRIVSHFQLLIQDIDSVFLSYHKEYILPFIHYSNHGKTITNPNYPYLSSVKSLWDLASPYYVEVNDISFDEIHDKLGIQVDASTNITILYQDNRKMIAFNDKIYTIEEFRNIFHLKSTEIYILIYSNYLKIITKGWGNGYGLSLFGALEIAKSGGKYHQILHYYFPKTKLFKHIKELS